MAYSTIIKPNTQMNTVLYTGNGSTQAVTGVGFQPDWTWLKARSESASHEIFDVVRGVTKTINSNTTNAEATQADSLTAFGSDGFTLGSNGDINYNNSTYVGWNWKAGGTAVSNTDGALTSTVSANQTSGFSIVKVTGTSNGATTIGHGLGVAPKMIIKKTTSNVTNWPVYHASVGASQVGELNLTGAFSGSGQWGSTAPTTTVFTNSTNIGYTEIFYCFADVKGFSKFGKYVGNGNTNGTFVYTGFKPSFVMWKRNDSAGYDWDMYDTKRDTYNVAFKELVANSSGAESSSTVLSLDILSNGFKLRTSNANGNASGGNYIYMAFAENPLVANTSGGIPTTAR